MIGWAAFIIACFALARSFREERDREAEFMAELESRPLLEQPEHIWRKVGAI